MTAPYRKAHLSELPSPVAPEPGSYEWKPVRHHFGIRSFGINAQVGAHAGDWVVEEHTELEGSATRHEELYYVARGHAEFTVGGERFDAPEGTFVHVPDPAVVRSAVAKQPDTALICIGAEPGAAYAVSGWELDYFGGE
jgi:hypothetical protein